MEINTNTINKYIDKAEIEIEVLRNEIKMYQHKIHLNEKEIDTMKFLIESYKKALATLAELAESNV